MNTYESIYFCIKCTRRDDFIYLRHININYARKIFPSNLIKITHTLSDITGIKSTKIMKLIIFNIWGLE